MKASLLRRGFTIIELLVVISIIAVLIAVLMPAIGKARWQAKLLQHSTNIRGLVQGYTTYAIDHRGDLARVKFSLGTDPVWFKMSGMYDHTSIFNEYGTMPLTASPLLGNTRMDDASNTYADRALPFYYFPGINSHQYESFVPGYETVNSFAPLKLEKGNSMHVMLQDQLVGVGGTNYWGTLGTDQSTVNSAQIYITTMPCYRYIPFSSLEQVLGCYTGTFDGAVALRRTADTRWSAYYYPNLTVYKWSHFQPEGATFGEP